jgi:hypothetical protein
MQVSVDISILTIVWYSVAKTLIITGFGVSSVTKPVRDVSDAQLPGANVMATRLRAERTTPGTRSYRIHVQCQAEPVAFL